MTNLTEKICIITGAGRGIGATAGSALLEAGHTVYFTDVDVKRVDQHLTALPQFKENAFSLHLDVSSDESVQTAIDHVGSRHGRIDLLINNAGTVNQQPTQLVISEDWNRLIDIHLGGTFRCCRAAFPYLCSAGESAIVNVSSIAGRFGLPIRASYCAAKAGIEGFTRSLATEWAEFGIRVNAVAPGWVMTELIHKDLDSGLVSTETLQTRISLKRLAEPREISDVMMFLAGSSSSYITGQVISVDGGLSIDLNPGNTSAATTHD